MTMLCKYKYSREWRCRFIYPLLFIMLVMAFFPRKNSPKNVFSSWINEIVRAFKSPNNSAFLKHAKSCSDTTLGMDDMGLTRTNEFSSQCNINFLTRLTDLGDPTKAFNISKVLTNIAKSPQGSLSICPRTYKLADFPIPRTGLLSFPGSGNSWTLHLLRQVTGIDSGSIYSRITQHTIKDDCRVDNNIVVKSHIPPEPDGLLYTKACKKHAKIQFHRLITLLRNPYAAFIAEFKRGLPGVGKLGNSHIESNSTNWKEYVTQMSKDWRNFVTKAFNTTLPMLVIFYEDLQSCLLPELIKMSYFLHNQNLTEFAYCCVLHNSEGRALRPPSNQTVESLYSNELKEVVNNALENVASDLKKSNLYVAKSLMGYMLPVP